MPWREISDHVAPYPREVFPDGDVAHDKEEALPFIASGALGMVVVANHRNLATAMEHAVARPFLIPVFRAE